MSLISFVLLICLTLSIESEVNADVVAAVDINTSANEAYKFNFPGTNLLQRNIEGFTAKEIEKLKPDMILMSPPCQPFSRYF
jgi:tRNA (cytosine38-C5)-methyltransferase